MKERLKKILPWVGYPLFYVLCFVVFGVLTFPYEKLKERIVMSFNSKQRETNGHDQLFIAEMSGYWLTGVKMKDIRLLSASTDPSKPPTEIKITEARASISLLPLIVGNKDVSFHLTAFGGEITGSYDMHGANKTVDVHLEGIEVGLLDPVVQVVGLPMEGRITGDVKLTMPEGKASKGSGTVAIEAVDVTIGDGVAKLKGALALPKMSVGTLTLSAEAKDGLLRVTKLAAGGKDLEVQGEGKIQMRELATESTLDVALRFKINDGYRGKSDITKGLFGAPAGEKGMAPMFEMDPKVKLSKRGDGFYGWVVRGQLGRPDFVPSGGGGPATPAPGLGGSGGGVAPMPQRAPAGMPQ